MPQAIVSKNLIIFESADLARWSLRAASLQQPQLGLQCLDRWALVETIGQALWGDPLSATELHARLRHVLQQPRHRTRFAKAAGTDRAAALLRQALLAQLTEWHASGATGIEPTQTPRDADLLALLADWRAQLGQPGPRAWYAGHAQHMLAAGAARLPLLRDQAQVTAVTDSRWPAWMLPWLRELVGNRLVHQPLLPPTVQAPITSVLECHSPVAERMAVARAVLADPSDCAVLVPADEVATWARHLKLLGVPVVAYLHGQTGATRVEKLLQAWADLHRGKAVDRLALGELVTGSLLDWTTRGQAEVAEPGEQAEQAPPVDPRQHDLLELWNGLRRSSGTVTQWQARLPAVQRLATKAVQERVHRGVLDPSEQASAIAQIDAATNELQARLSAVAKAQTCEHVVALLKSCKLTRRAARFALEAAAAQSAVAQLASAAQPLFADAWESLVGAAVAQSRGQWLQLEQAGQGACWVVPWGGVPALLPERRYLCGLDRYPGNVGVEAWLGESVLQQLGLATASQRAIQARAECDRALTGRATVSYRSRDGVGASASPSPWLLQRLEQNPNLPPTLVSRDSVAGLGGLVSPDFDQTVLAYRHHALHTHRDAKAGPWTGQLGVRPPASPRGYSVSALQSFASNPYLYFIERVVGLREDDEVSDSLDSREQGTVLHAALEAPLKSRLVAGLVDLLAELESLQRESIAAVAVSYGDVADGVVADAVWHGEADRWATELAIWYQAQIEGVKKAQAGTLDDEIEANKDVSKARRDIEVYSAFLTDPSAQKLVELKKVHKLRADGSAYKAMLAVVDATDPTEALAKVESSRVQAEEEAEAVANKVRAEHQVRPASHVVAVEHPLQSKTGQPLAVDLGRGVVLPMQGSIDRVEWSKHLGTLLIVDYKTGKPNTQLADKLATGEHLQLPLYAMALETQSAAGDLAPLGVPDSAKVSYLRLEFLRRTSSKKHPVAAAGLRDPLSDEEGAPTVLSVASGHARSFVQAIERGEFPLVQRAGKDWQGPLSVALRGIPPVAAKPDHARVDGPRGLGGVSAPTVAGATGQ